MTGLPADFPRAEMWTDATVQDEVPGVGSKTMGVALFYPNDPYAAPFHTEHATAGGHACSYTAESVASLIGLEWLVDGQHAAAPRTPGHLIWATDSSSLLQTLEKGVLNQTDYLPSRIWQLLLKLVERGWKISLVFVFSHCGTIRNDAADKAADELLKAHRKAGRADYHRRTGNWWRDTARLRHAAYESSIPSLTSGRYATTMHHHQRTKPLSPQRNLTRTNQ